MNNSPEIKEKLAKIIYNQAMKRVAIHCNQIIPEWVEGGNSIAQDDARFTAAMILEYMNQQNSLISSLADVFGYGQGSMEDAQKTLLFMSEWFKNQAS